MSGADRTARPARYDTVRLSDGTWCMRHEVAMRERYIAARKAIAEKAASDGNGGRKRI